MAKNKSRGRESRGRQGAASTSGRPAPADRGRVLTACLLAWVVPGGGHLWQGRRKGLVFLIVLPAMFAFGLALKGRLFPFVLGEPLVGLAALAATGIGLPYLVAWAAGLGEGLVTAVTYEYGNTFLIVAGLLNMLVIFDAADVALGRK